jgi:hypothetical protein
MKTIVFVLVATVFSTWIAAAQQSTRPSKPTQKSGALHPVTKNPCAQYGVGFAKVAGSDTCVKIGGSIRVEGGGNGQR